MSTCGFAKMTIESLAPLLSAAGDCIPSTGIQLFGEHADRCIAQVTPHGCDCQDVAGMLLSMLPLGCSLWNVAAML